jgi:hypothetical protein
MESTPHTRTHEDRKEDGQSNFSGSTAYLLF